MAVAGRKPKPEGRTVHRNQLRHDWAYFPLVPYSGPVPFEPSPHWCDEARDWWAKMSRLPHAGSWSDGDWRFAWESAEICHRFFATGDVKWAPELRIRERAMGATYEGRLGLHIRYELPEPDEADVPRLVDYRKRAKA